MATVTETQTANPVPQVQETNGTLVHTSNSNTDLAPTNHRHSMISRQPRPQSGVFTPADRQDEEERAGQIKTQQFLPWYTRWGYSISLGAAQGFLRPASLLRDTQDAIRSPLHNPNMTRAYNCRKLLPTRYVSKP
jgi:hypothetical protein